MQKEDLINKIESQKAQIKHHQIQVKLLEECLEEIIKEPKVLTADEAWGKDYPFKLIEDHDISYPGYEKGFKSGEKNGRLEMWLEFDKELETSHSCGECGDQKLIEIVENLKPLNKSSKQSND